MNTAELNRDCEFLLRHLTISNWDDDNNTVENYMIII